MFEGIFKYFSKKALSAHATIFYFFVDEKIKLIS
jgi:hypothetical protein